MTITLSGISPLAIPASAPAIKTPAAAPAPAAAIDISAAARDAQASGAGSVSIVRPKPLNIIWGNSPGR